MTWWDGTGGGKLGEREREGVLLYLPAVANRGCWVRGYMRYYYPVWMVKRRPPSPRSILM